MSFLAPQAYTKETLSKAFDWLQYQPDSVKQVATSPDVLVSLFLKAQRQGIDNIDIDAPVSSKRFLTDLKNLKKDFAPFEESLGGGAPSPVMQNSSMQNSTMQNSTMQTQVSQQLSQQVSQQVSQTVTVTETKAANVPFQVSYMQSLDQSSLQAVLDVQTRFNLSTPQEALRMLISVGTKQIRQWP
jgi:hypothetical protein